MLWVRNCSVQTSNQQRQGMLMIGRRFAVHCCSYSIAQSRTQRSKLLRFSDNCIKLSSKASRVSKVLVRAMVQMPARKVEVQEEAVCQPKHAGVRLDALLPNLFGSRYNSASAGKKAIRRKEVQVNGSVARTDMLLQEGDIVRVVMKVGSGTVWGSTAGKPGLEVAFQDEHMACIVKPQGLPTQGTGEGTVQGRIKYCLQPSPLPGALFRPHHAHRLDVNTGGLLLVAKTRAAGTAMAADLAEHKMQKRYLALVTGRLEGSGVIDYPLDGKPAVSLFRVEQHSASESFRCLTWVSLWPKTGRTHQLRKHCAYIGHPILGDSKYLLHSRQDCQATRVADVQQCLPQLDDLAAAAAAAGKGVGAGAGAARVVCSAGAAGEAAVCDGAEQQQQQGVRDSKRQRQELQAGDTSAAAEQSAAEGQQQGRLAAHTLPLQQQQQEQLAQQWDQQKLRHQPHQQQQWQDSLQREPAAAALQQASGASAGAANLSSAVAVEAAGSAHATNDREDVAACSSASVDVEMADTGSDLEAGSSNGSGSSSRGAGSGIKQRGQQLRDGTMVKTCLWAVQLQLLHPITRQPLDLCIQEQVATEYGRICSIEAAAVDDKQG